MTDIYKIKTQKLTLSSTKTQHKGTLFGNFKSPRNVILNKFAILGRFLVTINQLYLQRMTTIFIAQLSKSCLNMGKDIWSQSYFFYNIQKNYSKTNCLLLTLDRHNMCLEQEMELMMMPKIAKILFVHQSDKSIQPHAIMDTMQYMYIVYTLSCVIKWYTGRQKN